MKLNQTQMRKRMMKREPLLLDQRLCQQQDPQRPRVLQLNRTKQNVKPMSGIYIVHTHTHTTLISTTFNAKVFFLPPMEQHTDRRAQMESRVRVFMMSWRFDSLCSQADILSVAFLPMSCPVSVPKVEVNIYCSPAVLSDQTHTLNPTL